MEQAVSRRKKLISSYHLLTMIVELRSLCGTTPRSPSYNFNTTDEVSLKYSELEKD